MCTRAPAGAGRGRKQAESRDAGEARGTERAHGPSHGGSRSLTSGHMRPRAPPSLRPPAPPWPDHRIQGRGGASRGSLHIFNFAFTLTEKNQPGKACPAADRRNDRLPFGAGKEGPGDRSPVAAGAWGPPWRVGIDRRLAGVPRACVGNIRSPGWLVLRLAKGLRGDRGPSPSRRVRVQGPLLRR